MIKDRIREDMKAAMRSHEAARLSTIRLLLAAIKQREVDERIEADDAVVMQVIAKMVKQRRDSVQQYRAGGREDLASKEQAEIDVLEAYLPAQMSEEEIGRIIDEAVAESGASGMAAMGKVTSGQSRRREEETRRSLVKPRVLGQADMGTVSRLVKAKLAS